MSKKSEALNGYVIENNIPVPSKRGAMKAFQVALSTMKVGQSLLVTADKDRSAIASTCTKIFGKGKYVTRRQEDGSVRVWRAE